jgi:hypothetical protein
MISCLVEQRTTYTRPPLSLSQFYLNLRRTVPHFTSLAVAAEAAAWNPDEPMPLEIASESEVMQAFFPNRQPEPTDPLGAAYMWWSALLAKAEYLTVLQNLTWHPPAWGDYEGPFEWLSKAGIMQFVERCPGADDIVYVKFMPQVEHPMQSFGEAVLKHAYILTMVLCSDGCWRAWGLHENYFPEPEEIRLPS